MIIIGTGSRDWVLYQPVDAAFEKVLDRWNIINLPGLVSYYHGGADGFDKLSAEAAITFGLSVKSFPANWSRYGNSAGPIRNLTMIRAAQRTGQKVICLGFPLDDNPNSGTRHCMHNCLKRGIQAYNCTPKDLSKCDGLYQVTTSNICAGFTVKNGVMVDGAPILRWKSLSMAYWLSIAVRVSSGQAV